MRSGFGSALTWKPGVRAQQARSVHTMCILPSHTPTKTNMTFSLPFVSPRAPVDRTTDKHRHKLASAPRTDVFPTPRSPRCKASVRCGLLLWWWCSVISRFEIYRLRWALPAACPQKTYSSRFFCVSTAELSCSVIGSRKLMDYHRRKLNWPIRLIS